MKRDVVTIPCSHFKSQTNSINNVYNELIKCTSHQAQLFCTNAFSANKFCVVILSTSTAINSKYIVNTNNFLQTFIKENKYLEKSI